MLRIVPKQTCDFWIQFEDRAIRETFNLNFKWLPRILPCLLLGPPIKSTADKISYFAFSISFLLRLGWCSPTNWDLKVELGISKLASYRFISGIGIFSSGGLTVELPALVFSSGGLTYGLGVCSAAWWIGFEVSSHSSRSQDSALLTPPHRSSSLTFHSQIWFLT